MTIRHSIFIFLFALVFSACDETEDTIVNIRVVNVDAMSVTGAEVTLFSQPEDSEIEVMEETNAAGEAIFDLSSFFSDGQLGLFVLSIEIEADTLSANSIIQVIPEEVNELTVVVQ